MEGVRGHRPAFLESARTLDPEELHAVADMKLSLLAGATDAAGVIRHHDYPVASMPTLDVGAHLCNRAGHLVADDFRQVHAVIPISTVDRQIRTADATVGDLDADIKRSRTPGRARPKFDLSTTGVIGCWHAFFSMLWTGPRQGVGGAFVEFTVITDLRGLPCPKWDHPNFGINSRFGVSRRKRNMM